MANQPSGKLKIHGEVKIGDQGYFVMSDEWFDKYVYEVIINQKYISEHAKQINYQAKIDLPAWDSLR